VRSIISYAPQWCDRGSIAGLLLSSAEEGWVAGVRGQSVTYTVTPVPGKAQELSDLLRSLDSKEISIEPKRQRRGKGHDIER
jgi:hypothetical protein